VEVLVSTDDPEIARVSVKGGACVPWLRPPELATDTASSVDVCLHALSWFENTGGPVDGLLLLQPTSPFRRYPTLERGINLFQECNLSPVVGFSPASSHPDWCFELDERTIKPFSSENACTKRSQELRPAYVINGAFYLAQPVFLRQHRSFIGHSTIPLIMEDQGESLDIDTPWDWQIAECIVNSIF
jgi:CMP-N-acetylneuraminic acid synthetase